MTVDDTEKTNVLGFRDNNFSYGIQRYVSPMIKLSGKEDW
jgi:hypothetical protein